MRTLVPCICSHAPVAMDTTDHLPIPLTRYFLKELGRRLRHVTGEVKAHSYLLQRLSVAVQRGNAAAGWGGGHIE